MQSHMNMQVPVWPRAFWHGLASITEKEPNLFRVKQSAPMMMYLLTNNCATKLNNRNMLTERNKLTMLVHLLP